MQLERKAVELTDRGQAARPRKPDSGHTGTASITIRVCRASWNAMKPRPGAAGSYRQSRKHARGARESEGNVQKAAPHPADDQLRPSVAVERPSRGARHRIVWFIRTS
jgi:hypothetical protein